MGILEIIRKLPIKDHESITRRTIGTIIKALIQIIIMKSRRRVFFEDTNQRNNKRCLI